jgi:catechol 2,3-dioxygenase-like lactoylglutathione lyase family enzyme
VLQLSRLRRFHCPFLSSPVTSRRFMRSVALAGMSAPPCPDHVQIAAPSGCEEQARQFYGTLLGLAELQKPDPLRARGGVWFALTDAQLHIGVEEPFAPACKAHAALRWIEAELETVAKRLADAGAPVRWDDELPGTLRFFTDNPWGNRLECVATARSL